MGTDPSPRWGEGGGREPGSTLGCSPCPCRSSGSATRAGLAGKTAGRFVGGDPLLLQFFEDATSLLTGLAAGLAGRDTRVVLPAGREPHRAQSVIEASTDGRIGDAELGFDVFDDAAVLDEDLEESKLVGAEALEPTELEAPLDLGVTAPAMQPRHR